MLITKGQINLIVKIIPGKQLNIYRQFPNSSSLIVAAFRSTPDVTSTYRYRFQIRKEFHYDIYASGIQIFESSQRRTRTEGSRHGQCCPFFRTQDAQKHASLSTYLTYSHSLYVRLEVVGYLLP